MFYFTAAIRNIKFNKLSAVLTFITILSVCALTTLGMRIFIPAYSAFKSASSYASVYEAMTWTTALVTVISITGGIIMLCGLAPAASDKKKNILKIYSDVGATAGQIFAINLTEMLLITVAACPTGIFLGEAILYSQQDWICTFADLIIWEGGLGVWIFVAALTVVIVVITCLIFSYRTVKPAAKIRNAYPSAVYQSGCGHTGVKLGWVNFTRRKRPVAVTVMFMAGIIIFSVLCNAVSYAGYLLTSEIYNVNQSYNVVYTYDLYDEFTETYGHFKDKYNCAAFSSPNVTVNWTTAVTDECAEAHVSSNITDGQSNAGSNCRKMVVPDEDYKELIAGIGTVISPDEADGISAILINHTYDYDNYYKPYYIFEDTAAPSYGTLTLASYATAIGGCSAPVTVIGYTDEWPQGYDWNGYNYELIMCESDFLAYFGDLTAYYYNGLHYIRFVDCDGIYDEILSFVESLGADIGRGTGPHIAVYNKEETRSVTESTVTFVKNYVSLMAVFAAAVLFADIILMLNREAKSRKDEFDIYYSLGMDRGTFFAMLFTDYILLFAVVFAAALAVSVLLSLPLHWLILGYLKSFYIEWRYALLCIAALIAVSAVFSLYYTVKRKNCC